jgi:hypothetical protein
MLTHQYHRRRSWRVKRGVQRGAESLVCPNSFGYRASIRAGCDRSTPGGRVSRVPLTWPCPQNGGADGDPPTIRLGWVPSVCHRASPPPATVHGARPGRDARFGGRCAEPGRYRTRARGGRHLQGYDRLLAGRPGARQGPADDAGVRRQRGTGRADLGQGPHLADRGIVPQHEQHRTRAVDPGPLVRRAPLPTTAAGRVGAYGRRSDVGRRMGFGEAAQGRDVARPGGHAAPGGAADRGGTVAVTCDANSPGTPGPTG